MWSAPDLPYTMSVGGAVGRVGFRRSKDFPIYHFCCFRFALAEICLEGVFAFEEPPGTRLDQACTVAALPRSTGQSRLRPCLGVSRS